MRDIKFRVWDKDFKNMHVCGEDVHDSIIFTDNNQTSYYNLQNGDGSGEYGAYVLMQYTGITDKSGEEIYEDDICTAQEMIFPLSGTRTGVVKFIEGSYVLEDLDGKDGVYLFSESAEITVIGNIHDNPELLQPQGGGKGE
ncbi:YopX family protein [Paenibacillus sp. ALE1]